MMIAREHRWPAVEWLLIALLGWWLFSWLSEPEHVVQPDYAYYYHPSGNLLMHGKSPYGFITKWGDTSPMPPWFALLVGPLSLLPRAAATWCWLVLNLGMIVAIVMLAARLCGVQPGARRTLLAALALALWGPGSTHLFLGQSTLLVTMSAVGALLAAERGRLWLAGLLMVVAASKPHLVFLLGLGLTIHAWRTRRSLAVPGGFVLGLGAALLACLAFNTDWVGDLRNKPPGVYDYWGITVNLRTLMGFAFGHNAVVDACFWTVFAVGSALLLRLWAKSDRPLAELGALTLATTLVLTPYAQPHDHVLLIPALILLASRAAAPPLPGRRVRLLAALVLAAWTTGSLDHWLLELLESEFVWPRLEAAVGEQAIDTIWHAVRDDTRFICMLLPAGVLLVLLRFWKKPAAPAASVTA